MDLPDISIDPSSNEDSDFDRDSDASFHSSEERRSRRQASRANLASQRMLGRPQISSSSDSSSDVLQASEPQIAKRMSFKMRTSVTVT